ncbi:MCE family protein [Nocardioides sp. CFH 31398]|uniref:MCE family protein n=1 Tax=Nocardioides sp. CFH 31398 TaxID=2919579 RepID=UPI001F070BE1|nr:MCE family protein [Nocardioides sp. CFH 31398]MCH1865240.1 MCE family protein [Nocardioides sp. CFH 31398]
MRTPLHRLRAIGLALVGMLLLSSCDFSIYSIPLPGGPDTGDDPITITAEFRDVMDLVPQTNVKVDDVDVGRITDITTRDYRAFVTMEIQGDLDLPTTTFARIRQTSLLGEKFVSLDPPAGSENTVSGDVLEDGDDIPIEQTGRNPEVEEVFGALSLLLNGGGIGQLEVITRELNAALGGREPELRSALRRLNRFATVADDNSDDIIDAIDSLNELSKSANAQTDTINLALDEIPSATLSLDRQRDDLVEALTSLDELSDVGVDVIRASKQGTIRSLELLEPVLRELANADDDLAFSIQTFLTFPFVDETVGRDPQVARSIQFGDYVNLDIQLDLKLGSAGDLIDVVCDEIDSLVLKRLIESGLPLDQIRELVNAICDSGAVDAIQQCLDDLGTGEPTLEEILGCVGDVGAEIPDLIQCDVLGTLFPGLCPEGGGGAGGGGGGGRLPVDPTEPLLPDLPGLPGGGGRGGGGGGGGGGGLLGDDGLGGLLPRAAPASPVYGGELADDWVDMDDLARAYDADLTGLLVPGVTRAALPGGEGR